MSIFNSWYNHQKSEAASMLDMDDFLFLNMATLTYHAGFGYDNDELYVDVDRAWALQGPTFRDMFTVNENYADDDSEVLVTANLEAVQKVARGYEMTRRAIILRLRPRGNTGWRSKPSRGTRTWFDVADVVSDPTHWYELPVRDHKGRHPSGDTVKFVGPVSDRPYIHIADPYDEVIIDSEMKNAPITVDDILFASRCLCAGADRAVCYYQILSDDGSTLMLRAEIDNWST